MSHFVKVHVFSWKQWAGEEIHKHSGQECNTFCDPINTFVHNNTCLQYLKVKIRKLK